MLGRNLLTFVLLLFAFCLTEMDPGVLHIVRFMCLLGLPQGRQEVVPMTDLFLALPDAPQLLTSFQSSVPRQRRSSTWVHLPQACLLLPSCTGVAAKHILSLTHEGLRVSTEGLSGQLHQSSRVQLLERPSARWPPSLSALTGQLFHANCCANCRAMSWLWRSLCSHK